MRRATVAALLLLAGCTTPVGSERSECGVDWLVVPAIAAQAGGMEERPLPIECIQPIADQRLRVGFTLPGGPSCHVLSRVELRESADAVSVVLIGAVDDDPSAGACPDDERRVVTEIDLASPVDDRRLLDGSR